MSYNRDSDEALGKSVNVYEKMMEGKLTISRPSYGCGKEKVSIEVKDNLSKERFLTIEIDYDVFTKVLMGCAELPCDIEVRHLKRVGMRKETKPLEFIMPDGYSEMKENARKAAAENTPEGWEANTHFGSQNSFFTREGKGWARTTISRWVD